MSLLTDPFRRYATAVSGHKSFAIASKLAIGNELLMPLIYTLAVQITGSLSGIVTIGLINLNHGADFDQYVALGLLF